MIFTLWFPPHFIDNTYHASFKIIWHSPMSDPVTVGVCQLKQNNLTQ